MALQCEIDGIHGVARLATRVFMQWKPSSGVRFRAGRGPRLVHRGERTVFLLYLWLAQPPGPGTMWSLTSVRKLSDLCWKEQATVPMFQARPKWRQNVPRRLLGVVSRGQWTRHAAGAGVFSAHQRILAGSGSGQKIM
ncbi:hypothetical protein B0H17DRAFT_1137723 [Mycena rosella]|uniref:Uncharacterized protein n=1 Tax=Mycena rosella TaxID=1033263 RepID=A0AAD7D801_MYCRO|nr:hypothetical protein B0H17DRAFT_1137723 [Mycena rosella]